MMRSPKPEDALDVGEPLFSLVEVVLSDAGVGAAHLRALLLGELHRVMGSPGRIQPQQTCGDALRVSRGDRRCRNQRDQRRGAEQKVGVLHVDILEDGQAMSLSWLTRRSRPNGHGIMMWLSRNKVTSQLNKTAY